MKEKLKSRRLWLTIIAKLAGGYLIANGQPEAGAAIIGLAGGSYNIGQSLEDAAKAKAQDVVRDAIDGFNRGE